MTIFDLVMILAVLGCVLALFFLCYFLLPRQWKQSDVTFVDQQSFNSKCHNARLSEIRPKVLQPGDTRSREYNKCIDLCLGSNDLCKPLSG